MSAEAVGWVYKHSPYTGAAFSVHLAIADSANDVNDYEFWMALGKLGRKARVGRQAVSGIVAKMTEDGMLEVVRQSQGGRSRPSIYRFLMPDVPLVWHWSAPDGVPDETVASSDSRSRETVASRSQTVASASETVAPGDTRRTQGEPKRTSGSDFICRECDEQGFPSNDAVALHQMSECPALAVDEDLGLEDAREALRSAGSRGPSAGSPRLSRSS